MKFKRWFLKLLPHSKKLTFTIIEKLKMRNPLKTYVIHGKFRNLLTQTYLSIFIIKSWLMESLFNAFTGYKYIST
jgi:hypothetical protein